MKRVLFTGGTGFVGRNILPLLGEKFDMYAPSRRELDLFDLSAARRYLEDNQIEVIIHAANPNPVKNSSLDSDERFFEESLRMPMVFYHLRKHVEKVLFLGSGAEFDKRFDMGMISEEEIYRSMPQDSYGFAKSVVNALASSTDNTVNLHLFACFGPWDHESKFITHCIRSVLKGQDITVRQDCMFDYLHVFDLAKVFAWFIEHDANWHEYNIASGHRYLLSQIAAKVLVQMNSDLKVVVLEDGLNREYTADVRRLEDETGLVGSFMDLDEGIALQIVHETEHFIGNEKS